MKTDEPISFNEYYLYGFVTDLCHASMTDKTKMFENHSDLSEFKSVFYPLDRRLSAFYSSIYCIFNMILYNS